MISEKPSTDQPHEFPHQQGDGSVTPEALAQDVAEHPGEYHPALMPHIMKLLDVDSSEGMSEDEEVLPETTVPALTVSTPEHADELTQVPDPEQLKQEVDVILERMRSGPEVSFEPEDASKLIEQGKAYEVADNLDKFTGLDHNELASRLIKRGEAYAVADNIDKFTGLTANTAGALIESGEADWFMVISNLDKFTGLDHNELVDILIKRGATDVVISNLDKFTGLDHNELVDILIKRGATDVVANNLDKFTGLTHDTAIALIKRGKRDDVSYNLAKFTGLTDDTANKMMIYSSWAVANNLDKFNDLTADTADRLITGGYMLSVLQNPTHFGDIGKVLLNNLDKIKESNDIADSFVENIGSYGLSSETMYTILAAAAIHYSTAQKILQLDLGSILGQDHAADLRAYIATVKPEFLGVRDDNPYAETAGSMEYITSTKPGTGLHKKAREIAHQLREQSGEYATLAETARRAYDYLRETIAGRYGEDYATSLFSDPRAGDMWPTYRRLVADYIALQGDSSDLGTALLRANEAFGGVLEVDTKYYDKLFSEWDAKRIGQREFQEVFLGRDGVYAFIGRRAQLWARARKLGLKRGDDMQTAFVDDPTYLVYPRGFRDDLVDDVKYEYLSQRINNPTAAHYFDTGFTGTIPEDIMRMLGVSEEQWEARIRLLSASKRDRTVLGLDGSKDERDQIVNTVEYNVKDEKSAEGLYRAGDDQAERLEPYSAPMSPTERLAFRFTQLALHRHYYIRELDMDTAHAYQKVALEHDREMRVNDSITEPDSRRLEEVFASPDIGNYLKANAKTLKIADPSDPYPDEAVFELELPEHGEIIVKAAMTGKTHGPVDEFEALVLLEKLGIEAPKPLARVFTDETRGFIIMEKLRGISGRSIKNYFEENGLSDDNRQAILEDALKRMHAIAETVRRDTGLDKPWRLKDFMIEFETIDNSIQIKAILPIDFERAKVFDPESPHSIELGQGLIIEPTAALTV